ncbi:unnamed protein product, partial [Rotaria sordida]
RAKLQRQSSLCHSYDYAHSHHITSFHIINLSQTTTKQELSFMKTTSSSTNLTELLSSTSLVVASTASIFSSSSAMTDNNSNDLISPLSNYHLSTSISFIFNIQRESTIATIMTGIYQNLFFSLCLLDQ